VGKRVLIGRGDIDCGNDGQSFPPPSLVRRGKKVFVGDWGRSETRTLLQHQSQPAVKRPRTFKPPQAGGRIESIFSHRVLCEWRDRGEI